MTKLVAVVGVAAGLAGCTPTATSDPNPPKQGAFSKAAYDEHIKALRIRLHGKKLGHLNIRIEEPFVVVGDGTAAELEQRSETVRWAADLLEQDFFAKRPTKILDVFLFGGADSYERGVKVLTGSSPSTPYGFYSRSDGGLFMNIATGGGTLVHEIVHPYVEADFPDAPPWLNEGLGSLFEQCAERDGHIVGLPNWRLAGLQRTITNGKLQSFRTLTDKGSGAFYTDDSGTNYAQARYLLFYVQSKGLLRDFYRTFRAARAKDPTGFETLRAALGETDMLEFQARWERYVAKLRFP